MKDLPLTDPTLILVPLAGWQYVEEPSFKIHKLGSLKTSSNRQPLQSQWSLPYKGLWPLKSTTTINGRGSCSKRWYKLASLTSTDSGKYMLQTVTVFSKEILAATACKLLSRSTWLGNIFWLISRATPPEVLFRPELLCSTVYPLKDILEQSLWRVSCKAETHGWWKRVKSKSFSQFAWKPHTFHCKILSPMLSG